MKLAMRRRDWIKLTALQGTSMFLIGANPPELGKIGDVAPLRLNSNENQFGPAESVQKAVAKYIVQANYYDWTNRTTLREKIADREGLTPDHIILGAGSTELLQLAGIAFAPSHQKFISSYPTFPILMQQGETFKARWDKVPLTKQYQHDLQALLRAAGDHEALIYICNPNNPTGTKINEADLKTFASKLDAQQLLFVDEAYLEFSDPALETTARKLIGQYPNIIVARTFSKIFGMAGLRVGYSCAHPDVIKKLRHYQTGFGIDIPRISMEAARAVLEDHSFLKISVQKHQEEKQRLYATFDQWGVEYVRSHTSFIYFRNARFKPNLVKALQDRDILIRDYKDQPNFARVSIGTGDQMALFLKACRELLKN